MSYLVLARRWRPKRFEEVVGQPHIVRTLLNSLTKNRIAHAYLFSGPRGVGKTSVARLLSRALNCKNPDGVEPCGECSACVPIGEGRFIDVIEIDAASNRGIDEIRKLREGIRYAPIEGNVKAYIIDEVHMLTEQSFNALLKTLEEPPEHAYFFLATTDPQKVPATILSRCQRFDFRRVSVAEIRNHLMNICTKEDIPYDVDALDIIARKADGSIRDSLSLLDQVIAFADGRVMRQDASDVVGDVRLDLYFRAVNLTTSGSTAEAFKLDEELALLGTDPQDFIIGLESLLVQLLQVRSVGIDKVDIHPDAKDDFTKAGTQLSDADLIRMLQFCSTAEVDIRRKFNPRTRLQLLLLKLAMVDSSVILTDIINRFKDDDLTKPPTKVSQPRSTVISKTSSQPIQKQPKPAVKQESAVEVKTPVSTPVASTDILETAKREWINICDNIAKNHRMGGNNIKVGGYPFSYENQTLKIRFNKQIHLDTARSLSSELQKELEAVIGKVKFELELGDIPGSEVAFTNNNSDPALKQLKDRFGARLVN
ncbi:MAG: DNA polymerase III subunit gamma/tau [Candidatus Hatepunaea meridiana]|nr:DNA polymerase III subunit gamma/tau [Candidatus Hatepunaea meridiana]